MKIIVSTDDSVKRQITDSISENLTDSDLESREHYFHVEHFFYFIKFEQKLKQTALRTL